VKRCLRCDAELPLERFGLTRTGNHRSWCKSCHAAYKAAWKKTKRGKASEHRERQKNGPTRRLRFKERYPARFAEISRKAQRNYYERDKDAIVEKNRRLRRERPETIRARELVRAMVFFGLMTRRPCEACGTSPAHAHHPDHWKPLSVVWLCASCHGRLGPRLRKPDAVVVPREGHLMVSSDESSGPRAAPDEMI
jgi:hypothetical protein